MVEGYYQIVKEEISSLSVSSLLDKVSQIKMNLSNLNKDDTEFDLLKGEERALSDAIFEKPFKERLDYFQKINWWINKAIKDKNCWFVNKLKIEKENFYRVYL